MSIPSILAAALLACVSAADPEERAPGPKSTGTVFQWRTEDGLAYEYRMPDAYDAERGVDIVLVLHGANLDRRFGFAHHPPAEFRPADLVICPEGTTPNGAGGFNFRFADKDLARIKDLHYEIRAAVNLRRTYVYGHGQGASFGFAFAGAYPELVDGVVAHGGGVWPGTKVGKKGHHQAIAVMHGTGDEAVPIAAGIRARDVYRAAQYPHVHFRAIRGHGHDPAPAHVAQAFAWCEGMTTHEPERLRSAFERLAGTTTGQDRVALWQVARRAERHGGLADDVRARARQAAEGVEERIARHVEAIEKRRGRSRAVKLEKKAWFGHLLVFLQEYDGMPACEALRATMQEELTDHRQAAERYAEQHWAEPEGDRRKGFVAGIDMVAKGFLAAEHVTPALLERLRAWYAAAAEFGIPRADLRYYDKVVPLFEQALEDGQKAFDEIG